MKTTKLKNSEIKVSGLALGTWAYSGANIWGKSDDQAGIDTIHCALDHGITLIDTADKYGNGASEIVVGKALKDRRDKAVLATKVFTDMLHYDDVIERCEDSLKRIQTDYIDIYQIHWPNPSIPIEETFAAFEDLKKAGKIRMGSVCNAGVKCIESLKGQEVAMNQLPYSLIWRIVEKQILPATEAAGIPVCAYSPLAQGLLTGKFKSIDDVPLGRRETRFYKSTWTPCLHKGDGYEEIIFPFINKLIDICNENDVKPAEVAMNFLKRQSAVKTILVGARSISQLEQNLAAYEKEIDTALMEQIERASDPLKEAMGDNADLWQGTSEKGRMF